MSTASDLRATAQALREIAADNSLVQQGCVKEAAQELDVEKVRDFLIFFGGTTNG